MEKEIFKNIIRYQQLVNSKVDFLGLRISNIGKDNVTTMLNNQFFKTSNPEFNLEEINKELQELKKSINEFILE